MAKLRQNGLRMELHPFYVQGFVPDSHDFIQFAGFILCPRGDFQAIWQGGLLDDQGMITGGGEWIGQSFEYAVIVMINRRILAVHDAFGMDDTTAKRITNALMTKANAQNRIFSGKL